MRDVLAAPSSIPMMISTETIHATNAADECEQLVNSVTEARPFG